MSDIELCRGACRAMYRAMITKDAEALEDGLDKWLITLSKARTY